MLARVLRAPIPYFDRTPTGRIVNRFSTDIGILDVGLPFSLNDSVEGPTLYVGIMASIIVDSPWTAFPVAGLTVLVVAIAYSFRHLITLVRKNDLECRSPMFSFFTNTLSGILQVKAYRKHEYFRARMRGIINQVTKFAISFNVISRGLAYFLNLTTSALSAAGLFLIVHFGRDNPALIGLTSSYLGQASSYLHFFVRQVMFTGSNLVSASRCVNLTRIPQEDYEPACALEHDPSIAKQYAVLLQDLQLRYRADLPLVLRGLTLAIRHG
jgi:ATP-binding cassette subfamily C (CFTR/MRP) protein 4